MTSSCWGNFSISRLMCGRSCDEMPVKRARPLFLAHSRAASISSISRSLCSLLPSWQVIRQRSMYSSPACFRPRSKPSLSFCVIQPAGCGLPALAAEAHWCPKVRISASYQE